MIARIEISNYRSLQEASLTPGGITCLIGPNGSGKSNVLEAMELVRAATSEKLATFLNQRHGFASVQWFGPDPGEISLKARLRVNGSVSEARIVRYEMTLAASGDAYVVSEEYLKPFRAQQGKPTEFIKNLGGEGNLYNEEQRGPDRVPSRGDPGPGPRETFLGHFRAPRYYSLVSRIQEAIRSWTILSFARIDTRPGSPVRSLRPIGESGRLEQDGSNLTDVLSFLQERHPHEFEEIKTVTRAAFREIEELSVRPVPGTNQWVTAVKVAGSKKEVPIWNLSDGIIRFLCLAASLLSPASCPVAILDEPEVGMHPAMAPNVVEVLREAAKRSRQVFVATHSADLIDGMMPEEVTIVEKDPASGKTNLRTIGEDEDLKKWVKEYRLGELWKEGHLGGRP